MKELLFYPIAGAVIGLVAQVFRVSLVVALIYSLFIPTIILMVYRIVLYQHVPRKTGVR